RVDPVPPDARGVRRVDEPVRGIHRDGGETSTRSRDDIAVVAKLSGARVDGVGGQFAAARKAAQVRDIRKSRDDGRGRVSFVPPPPSATAGNDESKQQPAVTHDPPSQVNM